MTAPHYTRSLRKYWGRFPDSGSDTNDHSTSAMDNTINACLHDKSSSNSNSCTTTPNTSTTRNLTQPSHRCLKLKHGKPLRPSNHKGHLPSIAKELMNKNKDLKLILRKLENELFILTRLYSHMLRNNNK